MVFFVCETCNETLKRNKVEAHLRYCGYAGVTCVDCNATFRGEAYFAHSTCISEAEKYQGALFKANGKPPNANDAWVAFVENLDDADAAAAPARVKALVPKLAALSNVPRNEKKFKNFVSNSMNIRDGTIVQALWDFLSERHKAAKAAADAAAATAAPAAAEEARPAKAAAAPAAAAADESPAADVDDESAAAAKKAAKKAKKAKAAAEAPAEAQSDIPKEKKRKAAAADEAAPASEASEKKKKKKKKDMPLVAAPVPEPKKKKEKKASK